MSDQSQKITDTELLFALLDVCKALDSLNEQDDFHYIRARTRLKATIEKWGDLVHSKERRNAVEVDQ